MKLRLKYCVQYITLKSAFHALEKFTIKSRYSAEICQIFFIYFFFPSQIVCAIHGSSETVRDKTTCTIMFHVLLELIYHSLSIDKLGETRNIYLISYDQCLYICVNVSFISKMARVIYMELVGFRFFSGVKK